MRRAFGLIPALLLSCAHPSEVAAPPVASPAPPATTPAALPTATTSAVAAAPMQPPAPEVSGYDKPPQNVLDVLHAPAPAAPMMSPTRDRMLLVSWVAYPSISQVAEPYLKLAGVRAVEPCGTHRKHDTAGGYGVVRRAARRPSRCSTSRPARRRRSRCRRAAASTAWRGQPMASTSRSATPRPTRSSCGSVMA